MTFWPPAHVELWRNAPRSSFEGYRDKAIIALAAVIDAYLAAGQADEDSTLRSVLETNYSTWLGKHLADTQEIWNDTPIHRFLTKTEPIPFCASARSRYDGCCFHDIAIKLAVGLRGMIDCDRVCWEFREHMHEFTGGADLTFDYLQSFESQIRCECAAAIEKWQAERRTAAIASTAEEDGFVTRRWIAEQSGIPEPTIRGPRLSKILGPPDESELGKAAKWKKSRALEFIANHGRK